MNNMIHLKNRVLNQPLLVEASYAQTLFGALADKLDIEELTFGANKLSTTDLKDLAAGYSMDARGERKPYHVKGRTALIDVSGSLVAKSSFLDSMSGMRGYDGIKSDLDYALSDEDVDDITFMMNSSGGEVTGCFELADYIHSKRGVKQMTAMVQGLACSACYMLAAACDTILSSATSYTGSIGVITAHTSHQKMLEDKGVKITLITSGNNKADGNPYMDLPSEVLAKIQSNLKEIHTMFAERVASFRGISVEAVFDTQASTYMGEQALAVNLIDGIVSPIEYIDKLSHTSGNNITMESHMTTADKNATATVAKADHDAALVQAEAAGKEAGLKQGGTDMQARVKGILMSDKAAGKTKMAQHLAFNTSMSVDEAEKMLNVSAAEQVAEPVKAEPAVNEAAAADFVAAVQAESAEPVGSDAGMDTGLDADENSVQFALAAAKAVNG